MMPESVIGQTLDDKYKIESQLGKGGMGTVYLATHIGTERPVAVKVIASEFMKRAEFVERFRREARAAGRLRHPNVVDVTDFGFSDTNDGEVAYLVMEYLDGCTLGEVLKEEKNLPLSWTVDILEQVCSAVHEAHEQGIIHRDLKPDNIWLEPNQRGGYTVKVLDFGIAKLEETSAIIVDDAEIKDILEEVKLTDGARETIADSNQLRTFADRNNSTIVSESATMAFNERKQNFASETGTLIQSNEDNSEDGTAIFPSNQTSLPEINENTPTKILTEADENVTKIISEQIETDKSGKNSGTIKSLIHTPSTSELTRIGAVLGTPLYMSPEQCKGEKLTPSSDVYSLGVIAYQMLSGKTPFDGDYAEVMEAHKEKEPPALEEKKIPKKVKKVITASLSKKIEDRPTTAEGFASELRASSEGISALLRRALVIYSERITKFLTIAFLLAIPSILIIAVNVILRFLIAVEILPGNAWTTIIGGFLSFINFFAQIFYAALLVGMTTRIVAQTLATPLRPISIKETFRQVGKRWKPLLGTVTVSSLISIIGLVLCILPGVWFSARYMLIAPSIMMEGVSGRAAFRRSIELGKRSFRTVLATTILMYFMPFVLAITIGLAINGIVNNFDPSQRSERAEVIEQTTVRDNSAKTSEDVNFKINGKSVSIYNEDQKDVAKEKSMGRKIRNSIQQGLYELLWSPIQFLFLSFTSVITALLYFKTRQAGGESMQELLQQFEEEECPQTMWQSRVRQRLLQSGKTTTGKKISTSRKTKDTNK
jgi:serine/threonine protein kinase